MPSTALMLSKLSNPVKHLSGFSGFFTVPDNVHNQFGGKLSQGVKEIYQDQISFSQ